LPGSYGLACLSVLQHGEPDGPADRRGDGLVIREQFSD
jgi:hypothetical protein